ncbi:MAG: hypothetical protein ABFC62_08760 [Clostridiaceae bacterium]
MRKSTKLYLTVFFISLGLTMATAGAFVLTGTVYHHESHESVTLVGAEYTDIVLETSLASVEIVPKDGGATEAAVSLYAWRGADFHAAEHVTLTVKNGALVLTELPFPMDFLGFFPQPYAMDITLSVPREIYKAQEVRP